MSQINDGGPAFPMSTPKWHEQVNEEGYSRCDFTMGMTLRDYFAAKAMQFELTRYRDALTDPDCDFDSWVDVQDYVADCAYTMADAMLKRRAE